MKRTLLFILIIACLIPNFAIAQQSYTGTLNTDKVFFRMEANTDCAYHAVLKKGDKVAVFTIKGNFYHCRFNGKVGYVMTKFVDLPSSSLRKLSKTVSTSKYANKSTIASLGSAPGYLKYGDSGEDVEKLQRALQIKGYSPGVVDGKFGKATRDALKNFQSKNKLTVNGQADYATIKKLFGSVSQTTAKDDPALKGITSISQLTVPNTTKKGDNGRHVKALQQALKLKGYYPWVIDSKYGDNTAEAVASFQKRYGLTADGIAGFQTIKKLFGKDAANYVVPTQSLDWFSGGTNIIPKGASFQVKDVYSGEVFTCKRWSGYNHLDAEPANKEASAAIKRAAGGSWSWARRPILVKYNGVVYAASMNSMPHGESTISGNDFDGHFCIHFTNSKTHDSNRVDEEHQKMVNKALNANW